MKIEATESKIHVVIFLDGDGDVSWVRTIAWGEHGGRPYNNSAEVEVWAREELARLRAPFEKLIERGGRSVAESFVVYGSNVEKIEVSK